ncbi:EamA family transporter [Falsihalocynthiibacter sp. S25ZX9]|uniref:EamA family transporter n=1 Tax=Falsihalocynthiibacter sp. S25ZX9 TaxID=3240870 RepID=UPI0035107DED
MSSKSTLYLAALAPILWGTTYIVLKDFLPPDHPMGMAAWRALPAGLVLWLFSREIPHGIWWLRATILGALNFAIFWTFLFYAAYALPGGVAATLGALQPLMVVFLVRIVLHRRIRPRSLFAASLGALGIAVLVLTPAATLDPLGILAGIVAAASMALGNVLTRRWTPPVSLVGFVSWQLIAGGLMIAALAAVFEPPMPSFTAQNWLALAYLAGFGTAGAVFLWFRGLATQDTEIISALGLLSPITAVLVGWTFAGETLSPLQIGGAVLTLWAVWLAQTKGKKPQPTAEQT